MLQSPVGEVSSVLDGPADVLQTVFEIFEENHNLFLYRRSKLSPLFLASYVLFLDLLLMRSDLPASLRETAEKDIAMIGQRARPQRGSPFDDLRLGIFGETLSLHWATWNLNERRTALTPGLRDSTFLGHIILKWIESQDWTGRHELLTGLSGVGLFCLKGVAVTGLPIYVKTVQRILEILVKVARREPRGLAWHTGKEETLRLIGLRNKGHVNLGIAHGIGGPLLFLSACVAADINSGTAGQALKESVDYLLSFVKIPMPHSGQVLPSMVVGGAPKFTRIPAWCYGSPGSALPLWYAGKVCGVFRWRKIAQHSALNALQSVYGASDREPSVCHGLAGSAHMANCFYGESGSSEFRVLSMRWRNILAASKRSPTSDMGLFPSRRPGRKTKLKNFLWKQDSDLLRGAVGAGLVFLTPDHLGESNQWDELIGARLPI